VGRFVPGLGEGLLEFLGIREEALRDLRVGGIHLQSQVGQPLFERKPREVVLTDLGAIPTIAPYFLPGLPRSFSEVHPHICSVDGEKPRRTIAMAWNPSRCQSKWQKALMEHLRHSKSA
jgi:DNA-binding transcriptional LysR family regulator